MPAPKSPSEFLDLVRRSGLLDEDHLDAYVTRLRATSMPDDPRQIADAMMRDAVLTKFQAEQLLLGRWRRFTLGKYKVLERLGSGGMGSVYLCEHLFMRRRTAVKVLPTSKAVDPECLERFYREARAAAALDHPNIVRAYDIDQEDNLHFIVMEYVDGSSLQDIVKEHGPMDWRRSAHYVRQAALGLQHAHEAAGLVHRDIKPGNILIDRQGGVKLLDMGLARFFDEEDDILTYKREEAVLGTADYLAPEQAVDSHKVDIRADIYSLGATFYFMLTGNAPFPEGSVTEKLIWHQVREPAPIPTLRPDVPAALAAVIEKMMAKDPVKRYQEPVEVATALEPWTREPIAPPPEREMPRLSPAALATVSVNGGSGLHAPFPAPGTSTRSATMPSQPLRPPLALPADDDLPQPRLTPLPNPADSSGNSNGSMTVLSAPLTRAAWRWRLAIGVLSLGLLAIVVALCWWRFGGSRRSPGAERIARAPAILIVSRSGEGAYKTVHDALVRARSGDRIVVQEPSIEEALLLDDAVSAKGVTIEGDSAGKHVVWRAPAQLAGDRFLVLANQAGLHIKGFTIDGDNRVPDLIVVTGRCPGLTLEDVQLQGFQHSGVTLWDCSGERAPEGEIILKSVRVLAYKKADCALRMSSDPWGAAGNEYLTVTDCRFEGPYQAAVKIDGPLTDVRFRRNRFFQAVDGFYYAKTPAPRRIQLRLEANTFSDITGAGLHLAGVPATDISSHIELNFNLFSRTMILADADEPLPGRVRPMLFNSFLGNVCDRTSREGNIPVEVLQMDFMLAADPTDDVRFLRYDRNSPLNHAGPDETPVGVPPA
jgi:serine/threonine protein kinase